MSSTLQAIAHSAERSSKLYDYLHFNQQFLVETEGATTFKAPKKDGSSKSVILACMDTRLVNLLPRAMNIKDGDAKLLKTAGAGEQGEKAACRRAERDDDLPAHPFFR